VATRPRRDLGPDHGIDCRTGDDLPGARRGKTRLGPDWLPFAPGTRAPLRPRDLLPPPLTGPIDRDPPPRGRPGTLGVTTQVGDYQSRLQPHAGEAFAFDADPVSIALSPDGSLLLARTADNRLHLFDTPSGRKIREVVDPRATASNPYSGSLGPAFSPDGAQVLIDDPENQDLVFIDLATGESARRSRLDAVVWCKALAISQCGRRAVAACDAFEILHLDGKPRREQVPLENRRARVSIAPGGRFAASAGNTDRSDWRRTDIRLHRLLDAPTGVVRETVIADAELAVPSPDGRFIAVTLSGGGVRLFDEQWDEVWAAEASAERYSSDIVALQPHFDAAGRELVVVDPVACTATRVGLPDGRLIGPPVAMGRLSRRDRLATSVLSHDGRWVAATTDDPRRRVSVRELATGRGLPVLGIGPINSIHAVGPGSLLLTAHHAGEPAALVVTEPADLDRTPQPRTPGYRACFGFRADGVLVGMGAERSTLRIAPALAADAARRAVKLNRAVPWGPGVFSADGRHLLVADRSPCLVDARTGRILAEPRSRSRNLVPIAFSPDGSCVLTAAGSAVATVWSIPSLRRRATFGIPGALGGAVFSADNDLVVVWRPGYPNSCRVVALPDGRELGKREPIADLTVRRVAEFLRSIKPPAGDRISELSISADARWIGVKTENGTVAIYEATPTAPDEADRPSA
jgi:WD40 repeat protein